MFLFCPVQWSPGHENFLRPPPPPRREYEQQEEEKDEAPLQDATTGPAATQAAAPSTPPGPGREGCVVVTTKNTTTTTQPARRTVSGTPPPSLARTCAPSSTSPCSRDSAHPQRHHQKKAAPPGPAVAAMTPATVEAMTPSPAWAARTLSPSAPVPTMTESCRDDDDAGVGTTRSVASLRPRTLHFEPESTNVRPQAEEHEPEQEQEQRRLQSSFLSWTMAIVVLVGLSCNGYLFLSSSSSSIAFNRILFHRETSSNRRNSNRITPQPRHNEEGSTTTNNGNTNMEVVVNPIEAIVPPSIVTAFEEETKPPQHNDHSHTAEEIVRAIHKPKDQIDHTIEKTKKTNHHRLKLIPIETKTQRRDITSATATTEATTVSVVSTTTVLAANISTRTKKQTTEESQFGVSAPVPTVGGNKRRNVDVSKNKNNNNNKSKSKNVTNRKGSVTASRQHNSVMAAPAPATSAFTSSPFLPPPPKPKGLAAKTTRVVTATSSSRWSSVWSSRPTIEDPDSGARDHPEVVQLGDGRPVNLQFFPGLATLTNQYVAPFVRGTYARFSRVVTQHRAYRSRERSAFQQHLQELQQLHQDLGPHPRRPRRRRRQS